MRGELFNTQLFKELATNPAFRVALYLLHYIAFVLSMDCKG